MTDWGNLISQATTGPKLKARRIAKPVSMTDQKQCASCKTIKQIGDYYTAGVRYHSYCKVCERLRAKRNRRRFGGN